MLLMWQCPGSALANVTAALSCHWPTKQYLKKQLRTQQSEQWRQRKQEGSGLRRIIQIPQKNTVEKSSDLVQTNQMISWQVQYHAQWAVLFWQHTTSKILLGWQISINLLVFIQFLAPFEVPILLCTDRWSLFWHSPGSLNGNEKTIEAFCAQ